jgi:regulator of RNase E activity RraA
MLGYAATVKIRGSAPPMADSLYPDRTDWWDYMLTVPAPRVVVVQDAASHLGAGAFIGAVHMNILRALECVGVVTNGVVRSLPAAESAGFHLFAGGVCVSHAYVHIIEIGTPVEVGGLKVRSGDLLHGDLHGVQSIPLEIAARIPPVVAQITARKQKLIALCQSPGFTVEKLRAAVAEEEV